MRSAKRFALAAGILTIVATTSAARADALVIRDMSDGSLTAGAVAGAVAGPGVTISNAAVEGARTAIGTFSNGGGIIGIASGAVIGTGRVADAAGSNDSDAVTTMYRSGGDGGLDGLTGHPTYDAAALTFDFVTDAPVATIPFVFSSEEYNESVGREYDDAFALYVNEQNCARAGEQRVSINTINNGAENTGPGSNAELFRNNDRNTGGGSIETEMDGLTVVMSCTLTVEPGAINRVRVVIADTSDWTLDSNAFVGTMVAGDPEVCDGVDNDRDGVVDDGFLDTDADGLADCVDPDDDEDGVPDPLDPNPTDPDADDDGTPDGLDVDHLRAAILALDDADFAPSSTHEGHRRALLSTVDRIESAIARDDLIRARLLATDMRTHMDGCGEGPDADDWIVTCADQIHIRELVDVLIANIDDGIVTAVARAAGA